MHSFTSSSEAAACGAALRIGATRASAERATAADRPGIAQPVPERPVPRQPWPAIVVAALTLCIALTAGWERYWRSQGAVPGILDDPALWAVQWRHLAHEPDATVLVGSSRTHFDVQLPVWERLSGRRPIQLAVVGTAPLSALELLANERSFHGRVLVGVTPDLFFNGFEYYPAFLRYWRKETPSQRISKQLSMRWVEPWFAFCDPDFALFDMFARQPWPDRPGAAWGLQVRKLSVTEADRNKYLWSRFETDTAYAELMQRTWLQHRTQPPAPEQVARYLKAKEDTLQSAAAAVAKLRARGVPVLFVRHPSAGGYLQWEKKALPRSDTWDELLKRTGAPGIFFEDYAELREGYVIPEWSHMTRASAERYTEELYRIITRDVPVPAGSHW